MLPSLSSGKGLLSGDGAIAEAIICDDYMRSSMKDIVHNSEPFALLTCFWK